MDMKRIVAGVNEITNETKKLSNEIYPPFRNLHEAYAVIREEIQEAEKERKDALIDINNMWDSVMTDDFESIKIQAKGCGMFLSMQIAELIQAKAMCDKLLDSMPEIEKFYEEVQKKTENLIKEKNND